MTATQTSRYPSRVEPVPRLLPRHDPVVWGDASLGPLDADRLGRYERVGFLEMESLLRPDEVTELLAEVDRLATDPDILTSERAVREPGDQTLRSVFEVHRVSERFAALCADERLVGPARQILGSDVYVHQSRVNRKPGFRGREFYWHSDFETWHIEDGMPAMRALSVSISLTANRIDNGSLMIIPGSHRRYVSCVGETPDDHYRQSLRAQEYGVPDDESLQALVDDAGGIRTVVGGAGSVVMFDCNAMHGSNGNITPYARCNVFVVFNSVENRLVEPFGGLSPRPGFLADRS